MPEFIFLRNVLRRVFSTGRGTTGKKEKSINPVEPKNGLCYNTTMRQELDDIIDQICQEDGRYQAEVYEFVLDALSFTQKKYRRNKHVTGKELLEGIKVQLMESFGPMAMTVLQHWGVESTEDFGNIVFNLVRKKVLSKTEEDCIESFQNVFDFDKVFNAGYRQGLMKKISRMR